MFNAKRNGGSKYSQNCLWSLRVHLVGELRSIYLSEICQVPVLRSILNMTQRE